MADSEASETSLYEHDTEMSDNESQEPEDSHEEGEEEPEAEPEAEPEEDPEDEGEEGEDIPNENSDENMDSDPPTITIAAPGGAISMIDLPEKKQHLVDSIGIHKEQGGGPPQGHTIIGEPVQSLHLRYPAQPLPYLGEPRAPPPKASEVKYRTGLDKAPSARATPPRDIPISLVEIATFCPNWFLIPDVAMRACSNGMGREALAKLLNNARGQNTQDYHKKASGRIQKQYSTGGKLYHNLEEGARWFTVKENLKPVDDLTANKWELREFYGTKGRSTWGHVLLTDLADGVVHLPDDEHSGLMTRCIKYARRHPHLKLDTSHWRLIIHTEGWPQPLTQDHTWDDAAVAHAQAIRDPA